MRQDHDHAHGAGLEEPTAGDIFIAGERVNDALPKDRDVAMVFQNYGLYPHMSVAQNIGYPLKVRGISGSDREARIRQAAEKVELGPLLHRRPRELSAVSANAWLSRARSLGRRRVFLMDEPLSKP
jgi:multiple sugar transport system ATP-binding protein